MASLTAADPEILKSEDRVDLATEINDVVDQLQLQQPGLSYAQVVNALVAAYCPIVVELPNLTDAQKHARVTRFSALARQLTPANSLPAGSLVIATVPLSSESTSAQRSGVVNVPSANNVSNTSALASEFIICFTFATNTIDIAKITATQ